MLRTGWIPASLTAFFTVVMLATYGVAAPDLAAFTAYTLIVVVLPGTLLWRVLRGRPGLLAADVAAGTAVGYALTVLVYLPMRALGVPWLAVAPSIAVLVLFGVVKGLRQYWRGSGERAPWWWSWLLAAFFGFLMLWAAASFYRYHGMSWPGNSSPYVDMPFQLALAGELKHHFPGEIPYVQGEPLRYHWFFHAHLAATSWGSGVELAVLLLRLALVPVFAALVVLVAETGRAIAGAWWSGPAAVAITFFAAAPFNEYETVGPLRTILLSPTQTFGATIFLAAAYLLIKMWREAPRWQDWVLFGLLIAGVSGAKATYLPMAAAALGLAGFVDLITRRRIHRTTLIAFGVLVAGFAVSMLVLFRNSSTGLALDPLGSTPRTAAEAATFVVMSFLAWAATWAGVFGLAAGRRRLTDPEIPFCGGMAIAGFGAVLLTTQSGGSQLYFLNSARPYLAFIAVAGLAELFAVRTRAWRPALAVGLAAIMAFGAISSYQVYQPPFEAAMTGGWRHYPKVKKAPIPRGGIEVSRWLRDHSSPDDLVATNVHCRGPAMVDGKCDSRSFWVSGYTERHILVEGWAFTPTWHPLASKAGGQYYRKVAYWKPELLAANDAAFQNPNVSTVNELRDRYGVRWLLVDRRVTPETERLSTVADLRFETGKAAVYEIRAGQR